MVRDPLQIELHLRGFVGHGGFLNFKGSCFFRLSRASQFVGLLLETPHLCIGGLGLKTLNVTVGVYECDVKSFYRVASPLSTDPLHQPIVFHSDNRSDERQGAHKGQGQSYSAEARRLADLLFRFELRFGSFLGLSPFLGLDVPRPPVQDCRCQHIVENLVAGLTRLIRRRGGGAENANVRMREILQHRGDL
jgi:hypothetical protein